MSGLTVEDLDTCSPDALDGVAATMERLAAAMQGDKATVDNEVIGPLISNWVSKDGKNAVRLLGFVGAQLDAVRAEAGAMASILRECAVELRTAQNVLRLALEDIRRNGMTRQPDGRITWQTTSSAQQDLLTSTATDIANRIAAALKQATDADMLAATTLKANVDFLKDGAKNDFNAWSLGADPAADARRTADLMEQLKNGDLSDAEMQEVKLLTQDNTGDWSFKQQLMLDMGPEGLLAVTRVTADPNSRRDMDPKDLAFIQTTLRDALSVSSADLANNHPDWMQQLKQAGRDVTSLSDDPLSGQLTYGYQTLTLLTREGTYDNKFLLTVGDDILAYDKELYTRGTGWGTTDPNRDPVSGFLVALKNNPTAATDFFGTQKALDDKGREVVVRDGTSALQYLVDERQFKAGPLGSDANSTAHLGPLGGALVAATTGRPTTQAMVDVLGSSMAILGNEDSRQVLEQSKELRAGVTEMLAKNAESMHLGLTQETDKKNPAAIPATGPVANIPREAMQRVLADLAAGEPSNIEVLKETEERYARAGLDMTLHAPPGNEQAGARDKFVESFAADVGEAFGVLDASVNEDMRTNGASKEERETVADGRAERWAQTTVTVAMTATSTAAGLAAGPGGSVSPWVGFGTGAGGAGLNAMIGEFFDMSPPKDDSAGPIHDVYTNGQTQVEDLMTSWEVANRYDPVTNPGGLYKGPALVSPAGLGYVSNLHPELRPQD